jgi:aspartyl-tRNA(Asn)/glutamyl-tRNA(Gln) amidotransferase subunit B
MDYRADIGLEIHAELLTRSKMFCGCPVVDTTRAGPNTAVCPVCLGLPGALPVANRAAVEFGLRVALALGCTVAPVSIFARKNYFYPDLPKGYQISQYESPLAEHGHLTIDTPAGERTIRIHRVHLEEDTGKLLHVAQAGRSASLVDLNRAGVALLEIVTEPDLHAASETVAFCRALRAILRTLGINSGDMEKGVLRFEANVSVRPQGSNELGTKVEIKNLNSFKAIEKAIDFEIRRQVARLEGGELVLQETVGWEDLTAVTFTQRSKEEAHDYRYFPEPDLPPLVVEDAWLAKVRKSLPELPRPRAQRFRREYKLASADADLLVEERAHADFFEGVLRAAPHLEPRMVAKWITGELFAWLNANGQAIGEIKVTAEDFSGLLLALQEGRINPPSAKIVLEEMLATGRTATAIIRERGLQQMNDEQAIRRLVQKVLAEHPQELAAFRTGKTGLENWFFGQVMQAAGGRANPTLVREILHASLS